MPSFLGTETYAIDDKGRVAIPQHFRRAGGRTKALTQFVLTLGFEGCVSLYSPESWERMEQRLRRIPVGGRKGRAFQRAFLMHVTPVSVDGQGRITIPPALRSHAGLGKEAVLHGLIDRIEIWSPERLDAELKEGRESLENLAEDVLKDE
jgi:MraZ protein